MLVSVNDRQREIYFQLFCFGEFNMQIRFFEMTFRDLEMARGKVVDR